MAYQPPNPNGQAVMASSAPVVVASNQSTIPVSLATNTPTIAAGAAVIGKVGIDQTTPGTTNLVALAANQSVNVAQINGVAPLMGNGVTGTGSLRVTLASDTTSNTNPFLVNQQTSTVGTITSVAAAVTSTTILASNTARKGASVYNDSASATLYLSLSATAASTTVYSLQVPPGGYFELPNTRLYTGQLTGIWSAAVGSARVTENT